MQHAIKPINRRKFQWEGKKRLLNYYISCVYQRMHMRVIRNWLYRSRSAVKTSERDFACSPVATPLSAGANRNAFIAAAVRKIEENWDAQQPQEKLTTIGLRSRINSWDQFMRSKVRDNSVSFHFEITWVMYRNPFDCVNSQKYR